MKKLMSTALLAATLALGSTAVWADDVPNKVEHGAKNTAKTVDRGASSVGKGASKVYHRVAGSIHKVIGKNAKSDATKAKENQKAYIHYKRADRKEAQSEREMQKAKGAANSVGK
jgi:hypothetical protein